jgi:hypothetical protein
MAFERHRDKNGQMSRNHGNTLISTLRKHYGTDFVYGCADRNTLGDILQRLGEPSLNKLLRDDRSFARSGCFPGPQLALDSFFELGSNLRLSEQPNLFLRPA